MNVADADGFLSGNAVHQDKIGASNFFWSFPSEAAVKVRSLDMVLLHAGMHASHQVMQFPVFCALPAQEQRKADGGLPGRA